jgi:hypothetical protein
MPEKISLETKEVSVSTETQTLEPTKATPDRPYIHPDLVKEINTDVLGVQNIQLPEKRYLRNDNHSKPRESAESQQSREAARQDIREIIKLRQRLADQGPTPSPEDIAYANAASLFSDAKPSQELYEKSNRQAQDREGHRILERKLDEANKTKPKIPLLKKISFFLINLLK